MKVSKKQVKRLCWISWRMGSIGSHTSAKGDRKSFNEWWAKDGSFLLKHQPKMK